MPTLIRHQLWILAAASLVFFINLGSVGLWDEDEPLYAAVALDMHQRGDWIVPMYNGDLFPEKPPLAYWLMMLGYKMFGITELAVRFWSAVFGVGTALVTYHLGRKLFHADVGLWAGLATATTLIFTVSARAATVDSVFVFFTTLALLLFVMAGMVRPRAVEGEDGKPVQAPNEFRSGPWWPFALMYVCLGLAVLTKGPIGVVLPVAMMGFFLLVMHHLRSDDHWMADRRDWLATRFPRNEKGGTLRFGWQFRMFVAILICWAVGLIAALRPFRPGKLLRAGWQLRPLTAVVIVGAVAAPWFVLVGQATNGEFTRIFFIDQNVGRALNPLQGHSGPIWYYIPAIMIGFFPWSLFMGPSIVRLVRDLREKSPLRAGHVFVACWIGVFVGAWSVPSTKLPHYVLTAYPALSLMTACFVRGWILDASLTHPGWFRSALGTMTIAAVGLMVAFPIAAFFLAPGEEFLALFGLTLLAGAWVFRYFLRRDRRLAAMRSFAVTAVVFLVCLFGVAALRIDRFQPAKPMMAEIQSVAPGRHEMAGYHFLRESFVYYAGQRITPCQKPDQLREFLRTAESPVIFTTNKCEEQLAKEFPGELKVLARRPRFLRRGEIVVMVPTAAAAHTASRPAETAVE